MKGAPCLFVCLFCSGRVCASKFSEAENKAKRRGCSVCSVRLFTWVVLFVREGEDELVCFSRSLCVADEGAKKKKLGEKIQELSGLHLYHCGRQGAGNQFLVVAVVLLFLWCDERRRWQKKWDISSVVVRFGGKKKERQQGVRKLLAK